MHDYMPTMPIVLPTAREPFCPDGYKIGGPNRDDKAWSTEDTKCWTEHGSD